MIKHNNTGKKGVRSASGNTNSENVLSMYLKDINTVPLLSREEEEDLARRAAAGDTAAKNHLVQANLRFVVTVAKKYQNQGLPLSDLISEGNVGLMNAIERYDVEKGYHFISYAVWWIRQAILKALYEKTRMIRLPLNRVYDLSKIQKTRRRLEGDHGESPDLRAIAKELQMDEDTIADLLNMSRDHLSLDSPVREEKDADLLGDFIEDDSQKGPESEVMDLSLTEEIEKALETLTEREADVIRQRFGLSGKKPLSLQEIGDRYSLSKERIRQIEKKALKKLQDPDRSDRLKSYVA
jgi:RNA polymerase primary sigma factor